MMRNHKWMKMVGVIGGVGLLVVGVAVGLFLTDVANFSTVGFAQEVKGGRPVKEPDADIDAGKAVYFRKCVWCHGVEGAGDGPSEIRLATRPRNFNQGTFKIRHTASGELPLDQDLFETVTNGLPGSAMPPWGEILSETERRNVISFVKNRLVKDRTFQDPEETFTVISFGKQIASSAESIKKGEEIFGGKGKCFECHGMEGRGNGNLTMKDDWQFPIFPADLTKPWNIRGNRRDPYNPKNIFREISTGLNGTPMPSFIDTLNEEERWHVANFVVSLSEKYKIDTETIKPAFNVLIPSRFLAEGEVPADDQDKRWKELVPVPTYIGMASQIIRQPRHFTRMNDDLRVRSLYNSKEIAFVIEWNDRTLSLRNENGEPVYDPTRLKSSDLTHEDKADVVGPLKTIPELKGVYPDAVAIQIPQQWEALPAPEKPYFIHGDSKKGVDLWKWSVASCDKPFTAGEVIPCKGSVEEITGHGIDNLEVRATDKNVKITHAAFKDGKWSLVMKRALTTEDKEKEAQFQKGKYIPITFFLWDGDAGETGGKMALSTFYYVLLQPPPPKARAIAPPIAVAAVLMVEGFFFWRVRNKKK